jgi:chaperone BCS1
MFFTSDNDKWSIPICRQPRDFSKIILTADMQAMVGDVQGFMKNKDVYASKGLPFKRGYLLYGSPGTGKSTCIEVIANMYNMSVYILTLNSRNMTDTTLINLLCRVPPNSIITIEEIDKQMVTLKKNKTANVSVGGLLTAIDGPQRLSHSTIVIMTANTANFLSKGDMFALCRPGRIDQTFNFSTKFFQ